MHRHRTFKQSLHRQAAGVVGSWIMRHLLLRRTLVFIWYGLGIVACFYLAFLLRFDSRIPDSDWQQFMGKLPYLLVIRLTVFKLFNLYAGIWRYVSFKDAIRSVFAVAISSVVFSVVLYIVHGGTFAPFPRSVIAIDAMLYVCYCIGGRIGLRLIREAGIADSMSSRSTGLDERALIVGDLLHVNALLSSLNENPTTKRRIVGILVPRGEFQRGSHIHGIALLGTQDDAASIALEHGVSVLLAVEPFNTPNELKRLTDSCAEAGVRVRLRMIPSITELMGDRLSISQIRNVDIEDLMGRPTVKFDRQEVAEFIADTNVLVTGAGGSIGRELVRQLTRYNPRRIVLFENNEFALYRLQQELADDECDTPIIPVAGDVRFYTELINAFQQYDVHTVFHTAAYKHVPLMEDNIAAAMRTNVLGSDIVAKAAHQHGVRRLILVSSDKAVRPTSIMGATKRLAEHVVFRHHSPPTTTVAVRFGNVLGSSGSVIPTFKRQIAHGGPVTVTTPQATRYFMAIPEAVDLLLQAGVVGDDGDIMVLEMGQPVNIDQMARRLIKLSGFVPDVDIQVRYIGLRPGEKEYEELLTEDENVVRTPHNKIWVVRNTNERDRQPQLDIERITTLVDTGDHAGLRQLAMDNIPEHLFRVQ